TPRPAHSCSSKATCRPTPVWLRRTPTRSTSSNERATRSASTAWVGSDPGRPRPASTWVGARTLERPEARSGGHAVVAEELRLSPPLHAIGPPAGELVDLEGDEREVVVQDHRRAPHLRPSEEPLLRHRLDLDRRHRDALVEVVVVAEREGQRVEPTLIVTDQEGPIPLRHTVPRHLDHLAA